MYIVIYYSIGTCMFTGNDDDHGLLVLSTNY